MRKSKFPKFLLLIVHLSIVIFSTIIKISSNFQSKLHDGLYCTKSDPQFLNFDQMTFFQKICSKFRFSCIYIFKFVIFLKSSNYNLIFFIRKIIKVILLYYILFVPLTFNLSHTRPRNTQSTLLSSVPVSPPPPNSGSR